MKNTRTLERWGMAALFLLPLCAVLFFWFRNCTQNAMGNLLTQDSTMAFLAFGRLAGLLAVYGILTQIIMAGRVRWVEQVFGLDKLLRFHHFAGVAIFVLILAHPVLLAFSYAKQLEVSVPAQFVDFVRNWDDVGAAFIGVLIFIAAIAVSHSIVRKMIKYETWFFFHFLIYLAVGLSIGHQFEIGGDFTANRTFKFFWMGLYIFTGANLLFYRFFLPFFHFGKHRFFIGEVVPESPDVSSVIIRGRDMKDWKAKAGQFVIVRFLSRGFWTEAHPFSISQRPDGETIRLSIKRSGDFTARIPELKKGTSVIIDGPHGVFTAENAFKDKILLIAGGIGITPLRSLAEDLIAERRETVLLYAVRTEQDLVFKEELAGFAASSTGFKMVPILSNDPGWKGETGRLDREKILRLVPDVLERDVFVCGPPPMMMGVVSTLKQLGVPSSQIHYERFSF